MWYPFFLSETYFWVDNVTSVALFFIDQQMFLSNTSIRPSVVIFIVLINS